MMYGTSVKLIKLLLWGLSNLTCVQKYAHAFFLNEKCVQRCLFFLSNQNVVLASEAGFVVSQALNSISEQVLHGVWQNWEKELVEALLDCLSKIDRNNEQL